MAFGALVSKLNGRNVSLPSAGKKIIKHHSPRPKCERRFQRACLWQLYSVETSFVFYKEKSSIKWESSHNTPSFLENTQVFIKKSKYENQYFFLAKYEKCFCGEGVDWLVFSEEPKRFKEKFLWKTKFHFCPKNKKEKKKYFLIKNSVPFFLQTSVFQFHVLPTRVHEWLPWLRQHHLPLCDFIKNNNVQKISLLLVHNSGIRR